MSPFEVVYGFNPLSPLDLLSLPCNKHISADGECKAKFLKQFHEQVHLNIERRNEQYAQQANKCHKKIVFEPRDRIQVHMCKEIFLEQR